MSFGDNLKTLRTKAGVKQGELAKELNVTVRSIQKYEGGVTYPSAELLPKIAKFFNVSIDELMNEQDEFIALAYEQGGNKSAKEAKELISGVVGLFAGGQLSDEDKDAAMRFISDAYFTAKTENKKYTPKKYILENTAK